jgi:putative ABC transport system substrate-binding protein
MKRREFIALIGGVTAWPLTARAQQSERVRRIGVLLRVGSDDPATERDLQAFRKGLRDLGWTVGRSLQIDYRYAGADLAQMRAYAAELVRLPEEVILAHGSLALAALRLETQTLPIVFVRVADAVGRGFVASLAHPGGNVTGFSSFEYDMTGKWLGLLKEVAPGLVQVALMFNPETAPYGPGFLRSLETTAPSFAVKATGTLIHARAEIESAMAALGRDGRSGLIVLPDAFTDVYREEILTLAEQNRVPTVSGYRYFATAGGLISYGVDSSDSYWRAASYVDRILNGAKPADLPVQRPVKFELVINLKTAKALGLDVPLYLQQIADEVIE